MTIPAILQLFLIPLVNYFANLYGIEIIQLVCSFIYAAANVLLGMSCTAVTQTGYVSLTVPAILGFALFQATKLVGTHQLSLRYSNRGEREKNVSKFNAAIALGALTQPLLGSVLFYYGSFQLCFYGMALMLPILGTIMYFKLVAARDEFFAL